jgi:hypothetical protein
MKSQKIYLLLSSLLITVMSYAQTTRYVRPSAMGDGSGSSWQNASDDLQAMINASTSGDKIYVAVGTYVPNRKANDIQTITENNADNSFVLKSGVALYGGFDPDNGNTILSSRRGMPGSETATILSGDMDGDNNGNARHVVIIAGGSGYILDGFIIQQSNASSPPDNNISVNGHTISKNSGGGIYITNTTGSTFISNCWIRGNRSNMGAGVYTNVSVTFTNCIFSGNYTTTNNGSPSYGAGLYNAGNSGSGGWIGTTLINCTFSGNKAGASSNARGGAIYNSGDIIINNSIIYGNSSAGNQNGIHNNGGNVQTYKSLIGDSSQTTTTENTINGNPGFLNAPSADNAPFIIGDYKLNANSAAVNVGNNLWISSMSIDIQGLNRLNGIVDLGAHEREASYLNYTRYVKPSATGLGDGSSWANASGDLQEMINNSISGDMIFVAGGTYKPNRKANALFTITPNNRDNAFVLKNDVKIYGNFTGTESSLAQRNLSNTANKSILSGDFNGNDAVSGSGSSLAISNNGENAYHVVIASGASSENPIASGTILDGFTIKGGNANSYTNTITVNGKTVDRGQGGGLNVANGSYSFPTIANCIFTENYGGQGGAVSIMGMYLTSGTTFTNCVFSKNLANAYGGAFFLYRSVKLTNCTVWGNRASQGGGAFVNLPIVENFTIQNSIVYGNNSGIHIDRGTTAVTYSLVQGQSSTANGNINGSTNPLFTNASGGDFRLQMTSPVINKGNNSYVSNITADISGNPRIQLGTVDLGAYESEKYGTIWTTSNNWLNNVEPDIEKDVFIEGDLHVGTDYFGFSAKSLTVEETGSITIEAENIVTIKEAIINKAQSTDFVLENDGIVLQTDEAENQGDITVFRNSNPMKRLDYTLWSSPVAGMLLKDFSQVSPSGGYGTLWNRVYILGETAWEQIWDSYVEVESSTSTFAQAKGYLYRSRNDYHPTETQIFEGEFIGIPHNGTITASTPYVFNAVGNPYPSPMSADDFIMSNPGVNALYFWTNVNAPVDGSYTLNNWAYYTLMGGTGVRINGEGEQFYIPDGTIQTGQGFLVGTSGSVPQVTFNNSMRVVENGAFFRQMSSEKHRFWLNLSNEEALLNQILIGYVENATQGFDSGIDAEMFGYNGDAIYSLVENSEEDYVIQGRTLPFTANDVVPLGLRVLNPGSYSISLNDFDGVFEDENQAIYLKDNLHQLYHNLKGGAYTFLSENGTFENRFEIVYQEMMSTENPITQNANWVIYPYDKGFKIQTDGFEMKQVIVYDLLGREIYTAKAEGNTHQIPSLGADSVYIVKVVTTEDEMLSKKVR